MMERGIRKILTFVICQQLQLKFSENNTEALVISKKTQVPLTMPDRSSSYKFYSAVFITFLEI